MGRPGYDAIGTMMNRLNYTGFRLSNLGHLTAWLFCYMLLLFIDFIAQPVFHAFPAFTVIYFIRCGGNIIGFV